MKNPVSPGVPATVLPGDIRQNGYVVRDLDAAMGSWLALGVGPWFTLREHSLDRFRHRGEASEPVISIALANSGPLQIELIQQHGDAPSAYREFLDAGREGFHHLAWWAEDFPTAMTRARAAGWTTLQEGGNFGYFETGGPGGAIVEVTELSDGTRWMNQTVADAAAGWDGVTEPIRTMR